MGLWNVVLRSVVRRRSSQPSTEPEPPSRNIVDVLHLELLIYLVSFTDISSRAALKLTCSILRELCTPSDGWEDFGWNPYFGDILNQEWVPDVEHLQLGRPSVHAVWNSWLSKPHIGEGHGRWIKHEPKIFERLVSLNIHIAPRDTKKAGCDFGSVEITMLVLTHLTVRVGDNGVIQQLLGIGNLWDGHHFTHPILESLVVVDCCPTPMDLFFLNWPALNKFMSNHRHTLRTFKFPIGWGSHRHETPEVSFYATSNDFVLETLCANYSVVYDLLKGDSGDRESSSTHRLRSLETMDMTKKRRCQCYDWPRFSNLHTLRVNARHKDDISKFLQHYPSLQQLYISNFNGVQIPPSTIDYAINQTSLTLLSAYMMDTKQRGSLRQIWATRTEGDEHARVPVDDRTFPLSWYSHGLHTAFDRDFPDDRDDPILEPAVDLDD